MKVIFNHPEYDLELIEYTIEETYEMLSNSDINEQEGYTKQQLRDWARTDRWQIVHSGFDAGDGMLSSLEDAERKFQYRLKTAVAQEESMKQYHTQQLAKWTSVRNDPKRLIDHTGAMNSIVYHAQKIEELSKS